MYHFGVYTSNSVLNSKRLFWLLPLHSASFVNTLKVLTLQSASKDKYMSVKNINMKMQKQMFEMPFASTFKHDCVLYIFHTK